MSISKTPENIRNMFNTIAQKYDLMNNLMSFGLHKLIKRDCLKALDIKPHSKILDACCGTGDLTDFIKQIEPLADITGVDFSENMLKVARKRLPAVEFIETDITNTGFDENTFDFVIMGFGLRNVANPEKALNEIYRILKPGGEFLQLDFGRKNPVAKIFDLEVPLFAKMFYKDASPYEYLIKSKNIFPEPEDLIKDFEKCGFKFKLRRDYLFGVISAQIMKK